MYTCLCYVSKIVYTSSFCSPARDDIRHLSRLLSLDAANTSEFKVILTYSIVVQILESTPAALCTLKSKGLPRGARCFSLTFREPLRRKQIHPRRGRSETHSITPITSDNQYCRVHLLTYIAIYLTSSSRLHSVFHHQLRQRRPRISCHL